MSDDYDRILEMVSTTVPLSRSNIVRAAYLFPPPLAQQGVSWFLRKAISFATVTLTVKQYVDKDGLTHIDIQQVATGGISGTTENRTLDWTWRDHKDGIFGQVKGKSRWVKLEDVDDDEFLKTGYDDMEGEHIQSYVENDENGWTADQVSSWFEGLVEVEECGMVLMDE